MYSFLFSFIWNDVAFFRGNNNITHQGYTIDKFENKKSYS